MKNSIYFWGEIFLSIVNKCFQSCQWGQVTSCLFAQPFCSLFVLVFFFSPEYILATIHFCQTAKRRLERKIVFCLVTAESYTKVTIRWPRENMPVLFCSPSVLTLNWQQTQYSLLSVVDNILSVWQKNAALQLKQGLFLCSIINILILKRCFSVYCTPLAEEQVS